MIRKIPYSTKEAYRYLSFVGGLFLFCVCFLFPENSYNPIWLRVTMCGLLMLILPVSFFIPLVEKRISAVTSVVLGAIVVWFLFLLYQNRLSTHYYVAYILINFTILFAVNSRRSLLFIILISILGFGLVAWTVENPRFDPVFAFLSTAPAMAVAGFTIFFRINTIRQHYEKSNFINYSAVGASRDGILVVDAEGNFIRANRPFHDYMKVPEEYIQQNKLEEAFQAACEVVKDEERLSRLLEKPRMKGEAEAGEEFEMKDGRILEISYISVLRDEKLMGRLWFFKDITQRKLFEARLIESERQAKARNAFMTELAAHPSAKSGDQNGFFEEVVEHSARLLEADSVSIWFYDLGAKQMNCMKNYIRETGEFSTSAVISFEKYPEFYREMENSRLLVVPDTRQHPPVADFAEGKYTAVALGLCNAQIRSGGELIGILNVETRTPRAWSVDDQNFIASLADLIAIYIEQHRRRQISEQLSRFNAILTTTFELSETGILVVDKEQTALHYNELFMRIWNMTPEFIETADYPTKMEYINSQVKAMKEFGQSADTILTEPRGELSGIIEFLDGRVVERYSKAIDLGDGKLGRVWFYLDVTDRTRKEKELIERNFELDSFVYRASHDLKAPLNSIMGLIGIIREEQELENILRYIALMDKSVKKLDEFIRQLTQFSQDARLKVVRKQIDLTELVREVWRDLGFMENAHKVDFSVNNGQAEAFFGDPVRLNIVLNNLISNAVKYQDLSKPQAQIEVGIEVDEQQAAISVRDNGVGIPADHLSKVFDLFYRASNQSFGSGLGLYITRNATEKMGGHLNVDSESGEGTTFRLFLPNRAVKDG